MLENSKSHKHLGVTFNSNGKWKDHINEIYTKACRRINMLRLTKHKLDSHWKNYILDLFLQYWNMGKHFGIIVAFRNLTYTGKCTTKFSNATVLP